MDSNKSAAKSSIPLKQRDKEYYELKFSKVGLPPGTDSYDHVDKNPRLPRSPATPKRPLPPLPPKSERKGKWLGQYLELLDPETEYDQIVRVCSFYGGSDFNTALGYAAVFVWLTSTPAGANAVHSGKVITRGHQRYYETQEMNLHWIHWGSGSQETKDYCEKINKVHSGVWSRVPGAFSFAWEAQAAIILLSWYESYIRRTVGAKSDIFPQLKKAWPAWGERLTAHFKSEPSNGSTSFGNNYPRDWNELDRFANWYIAADFDDQRTEEDITKGHETAEAFIHQWNELWFPRPLHWLGRAVLITFLPPGIRRKQQLEDPNPILEFVIKKAFKLSIDFGDTQSDPVAAPLDDFYGNLQSWDMKNIDARQTAHRDAQTRGFGVVFAILSFLVLGSLYYRYGATRPVA